MGGINKADKHSDVISGKKIVDQILLKFLETFETSDAMGNNENPKLFFCKENSKSTLTT